MKGRSSFRRLLVWQNAMDLAETSYKLTLSFPNRGMYGLSDQIRRASVSVAANIAEGQSRYSIKEFITFLGYSAGSLAELETHFTIAFRVGYLTNENLKQVILSCDEIGKMLAALRNKLTSSG